VDTGFSGRAGDPEAHRVELERWNAMIPLRRVATPKDVGDIIAFLGSDAAGYLNGCSITVDGGVLA
jgi:NAD(P)-dependent dehydrogenase (short-subunit alcohol dehydrogenase family)